MYPSVSAEIPRYTVSPQAWPQIAEQPAQQYWFAVYTYPQHEKTCARQLEQRGINAFLPTYSQEKVWRNRQRVKVQLPLFPSYLFVHISSRERFRVLDAPAVLRVLGNANGPEPVPDAAIELLRAEPFRGRLEPQPNIVVGQKVRVRSGAMRGVEGVLMRKKNSLWFVISIDLINQRAMVEVNPKDIESLPA